MTDTTPEESPSELDPELSRCSFQLMINTYDVKSLREGLDRAALSVGHFGLGAFFIIATDPSSGDQWVVDGDQVTPMDVWEARVKEAEAEAAEDDADEALEEAVDSIVDQQKGDVDGEADAG